MVSVKRLAICFMVFAMVFSSTVFGEVSDATKLNELGIVKTNELSSNLSTPVKKVDAYMSFIRLIGFESIAKKYNGKLIYKDSKSFPSDKAAAINYSRYNKELSLWIKKGDVFSCNSTITIEEYMRHLLKALGYQQGKDYSDILLFSKGIGLISEADVKIGKKSVTTGDFYRITINSLRTKRKDGKVFSVFLSEKKILSDSVVKKYKLNDPDSDLENFDIEAEEGGE
ncbi:MAG: hypothetical protein RR838_10745 [Clostridium sp.]